MEHEIELIKKYQNTGDESIILHIIEHPWAYSAPAIMWAINVQCELLEKRNK
jgi:hypothetical protein